MIADTDAATSHRTLGHHLHRRPSQRLTSAGDPLDSAVGSTSEWLLARQHADGYWVAELEGDTILESEYVLMMAFLGRHDDELCVKLCRYLLEQERPAGGWSIYPGGPMELSATVKAYFALKLVGVPMTHPAMVRAREAILEAGGADACNSFTRFYLALLGQISYDDCPTVPTMLVRLPNWFPLGLQAMSAWTRTIVVPLSIISALKPVRELPEHLGIQELFRSDLPKPTRRTRNPISWENFFLTADRLMKWGERFCPKAWRTSGVKAAHRWMIDHFENSDGLGAIFPPMIYTVIALKCLGYDDDDPSVLWAKRHLEDLLIEEGDATRVQPCVSPVWDTAISAIALVDAKLPDFHPSVMRAVRWLLDKEVRVGGDWRGRVKGDVEPSGWYFQFQNEKYPDIDDTAMVLLALQRTALADSEEVKAATERGLRWILSMQNKDGGWAAFDRDITNEVLTKIPFADHNAILDPSCADITARVIELMGILGRDQSDPAIARALDYLWKTQEPEGCWYGRWGVNYIYGTWQVLLGLKAIGFPMDDPRVRRAADWLESAQQIDGAWGESCLSYDDPTWMGKGEPTPTQTAWALMGLIAAGRGKSDCVRRGIEYLVDSQAQDGTWSEPTFTGTGFPRVFYLRYHFYRIYFPLMALSRYRAEVGRLIVTSGTPGALASRVPALPRSLEV